MCDQVLCNIVRSEATKLWKERTNLSQADRQAADAEIFVDASGTGMGAYLVQRDTNKVSSSGLIYIVRLLIVGHLNHTTCSFLDVLQLTTLI